MPPAWTALTSYRPRITSPGLQTTGSGAAGGAGSVSGSEAGVNGSVAGTDSGTREREASSSGEPQRPQRAPAGAALCRAPQLGQVSGAVAIVTSAGGGFIVRRR